MTTQMTETPGVPALQAVPQTDALAALVNVIEDNQQVVELRAQIGELEKLVKAHPLLGTILAETRRKLAALLNPSAGEDFTEEPEEPAALVNLGEQPPALTGADKELLGKLAQASATLGSFAKLAKPSVGQQTAVRRAHSMEKALLGQVAEIPMIKWLRANLNGLRGKPKHRRDEAESDRLTKIETTLVKLHPSFARYAASARFKKYGTMKAEQLVRERDRLVRSMEGESEVSVEMVGVYGYITWLIYQQMGKSAAQHVPPAPPAPAAAEVSSETLEPQIVEKIVEKEVVREVVRVVALQADQVIVDVEAMDPVQSFFSGMTMEAIAAVADNPPEHFSQSWKDYYCQTAQFLLSAPAEVQ